VSWQLEVGGLEKVPEYQSWSQQQPIAGWYPTRRRASNSKNFLSDGGPHASEGLVDGKEVGSSGSRN